MSKPRKHHVVTAGLQRNFADAQFVRLVSLTGDFDKVVPVRSAFFVKDFNTLRTPSGANVHLENEWARVEGWSLPHVRQVSDGGGTHTPEFDVAAKALMATHWTRGYAMREWATTAFGEYVEEHKRLQADNPKLLRAFVHDFGRQPEPGEVEAHIERCAAELKASGHLDVDRMVRHYNYAMRYLEPLHVQLIRPASRAFGFILSDNPVVMRKGLVIGVQNRIGLERADDFFMPLTRWLAVTLTAERQAEVSVPPLVVQQLNQITRRNAVRFVACHPAEDLARALATRAVA